jgi:hypothetical protein
LVINRNGGFNNELKKCCICIFFVAEALVATIGIPTNLLMTSSPFCINPRLPTSVYYIPGHCSFKTKQNERNNLAKIERTIF